MPGGGQGSQGKRIHAGAYSALADALTAIYWNKRPFETFLRRLLRDQPELLAGLDFDGTKRETADELIDRLVENENRYQELSLRLMRELSSIEQFPNLVRQQNAKELLEMARAAVAGLRWWTERHQALIDEQEDFAQELAAIREQSHNEQSFVRTIDSLKAEFLSMQTATDAQQRGYDFERFLNKLFALFDMEPHLKYSLKLEQIDGSLSFDTDDYIVEAKWWSERVGRPELDVFAAQVSRKGKNALGIFIAVNGFASTALDQYNHSTPFLAVDGGDLFAVLDRRVRLDDLIKRKKRYANDTGHCFFPASQMIAE